MNPTVDILRAIFALGFVLGLMWLLSFLLKKYGWRFGLPTPMNSGRTRRLQLIEMLPVDARSKIILVRRDQTEHLILVGPQGASVVEQNILSSTPPMTEKP